MVPAASASPHSLHVRVPSPWRLSQPAPTHSLHVRVPSPRRHLLARVWHPPWHYEPRSWRPGDSSPPRLGCPCWLRAARWCRPWGTCTPSEMWSTWVTQRCTTHTLNQGSILRTVLQPGASKSSVQAGTLFCGIYNNWSIKTSYFNFCIDIFIFRVSAKNC